MTRVSHLFTLLVISIHMVSAAALAPQDRPIPAYWVFLNTGKDRSKLKGMSQTEIEKMQSEHVGNFGAQFDKGTLFTAGPLGDNGFIRGIVVVNARNPEQVQNVFKPDPFVQNGILDAESYPWIVDVTRFGSPKVPFKIAQYTLGIVKRGKRWSGPDPEPDPGALLHLIPGLRPLDRSGELAISGPLLNAGDKLGILLFATADMATIRSQLDKLPALKDGIVIIELHPQYIGTGVLRDPAEDVAPPKPGRRISLSNPDYWEGDTAHTWHIERGVMTGGSLTETGAHNAFLCTKRDYGNFDLRMRVRLVGTGFVNGGVQFRSQRIANPPYEMTGYQADMGEGYWGCLYDESRRNKILAHTHAETIRRILRPNDWNDYVLRCEGKRIRLWLNGILTVDYTEQDDAIPLSGKIGLQIHGGGKSVASYKDITIEELPE